ncbi:ABC transporter permease [Armatimonas rosea]|uniref:Sodium transport system permease protein n=1 Tax=Armatimonas rosea TaxID=685828 RepID=A0A7W9W5W4_ARMRO|nr:ABC transporter permease [Armatimonas rosea]MBB6049380.1 sodium transport system permease protein [Armatimonas rosea]
MWQIIFKKEFKEIFSDSRTRFNVIASPLLITPLVLALIGTMAQKQAKDSRNESIKVGVVGMEKAPHLMDELKGANKIILEPVATVEAAEENIRKRTQKAALILPDDADERLDNGDSLSVPVVQDAGNEASEQAAKRVKELLTERGDLLAARRLQDAGLSKQLVKPFLVGDKKISGSGGSGMQLLATFLPYILALSAIMGGMMAATDSVAGEKERGTLETLLVAPLSRRDIALGKFCTVTATALVSSLLSIVGLFWPFYIKLPMFDWMTRDGLSLGPSAFAAILLVQLPLAVLGAGVLLALSTMARNQKEMQTMMGPIILAASVGAMLSMLVRADAELYWAVVPITNAGLVLKQALQGMLNPTFVGLACAMSVVYAAVAVAFAASLFKREEVLARF